MASSSLPSPNNELVLVILKFLKDEKLYETAHSLEREAGCFFDLKYFEGMVLGGKFDEAENYLSGFTHIHHNLGSTKIFFELRKQKFLEALDKKDGPKALDILTKDFKEFTPYNDRLYQDAAMLLTLDDFRKHGALRNYGETRIERIYMMNALVKYIAINPAFQGKLGIPPSIDNTNLQRLIMFGAEGNNTSNDLKLTLSKN